ncbi:MAG: UDP-glucose 4-epimerase GalE [Candidatus Izemoplasmatales bacterium]
MRLVVAGGAGYIGSHFVKAALAEGHQVLVIDNLQTGHLQAVNSNAPFYQGDLRDKDFLRSVFSSNEVDAVIHFAANSLVGESMKDPLKYFNNNVSGTITLLEAMQEFKITKIVFSSSAAVYGNQLVMPLTESSPTIPTNPYGQTKLMMEQIMKWADQAWQLKYVSLRYFNVAGASLDSSLGEDHHPETHLIPIILQVPLGQREALTIFGNDYQTPDGTCIRDYIHVEDLAKAHLLALHYLSQNQPSQIFNLGTKTGYSNLEVLEAVRRVTGHPVPMVFGPRREGDPDQLVASYDLAKEILGWSPTKSLDESIDSAYRFHQEHPHGFDGGTK